MLNTKFMNLFNKNNIYLEPNSSLQMNLFYTINYLTNNSDHQNYIHQFKMGYNTDYYSKIFIEALSEILKFENKNEFILIPVAASTISNNEIRYKDLFDKISKGTQVENGFDCVQILYNKVPKHLEKTAILENNIQFNLEKLKNKNIILLDDVYTRGETMSFYCRQINKANPKSITAITLGKTSYNDYKKEEDKLLKFRQFKFNKIIDFHKSNNLYQHLNGENIQLVNSSSYEIYNLINGIKEGNASLHHKNGSYEEYIYKNGVIDGKKYLYTLNGEKIENFYVNGEKQSLEIKYYPTGAKEEYHILNNKIHGEYIYTDSNGVVKKFIYKNGEQEEENNSLIYEESTLSKGFIKTLNFLNKKLTEEVIIKIIKNAYFERMHFQGQDWRQVNYRIDDYFFKKVFGKSLGSAVNEFEFSEHIITDYNDLKKKQACCESNRYKTYLDLTKTTTYSYNKLDASTAEISFRCNLLNDESSKSSDLTKLVIMVSKPIIIVYRIEARL
ncbi:hypothetical protein [Cetobacterium sp.]|uniref:hypothetical protein n=1 Tax=Cetobacterium sp. TaxID=2071632 RepID=UPI003F3D1781